MTTTGRDPIRVTVDAGLRSRMISRGLRAVLRPVALARGSVGWVVLGIGLGAATSSVVTGLVVALGVPVLVNGLAVVVTLRRMRTAVGVGSVLTSAYDDRGRLVVTRDTGDLVLQPGSAAGVDRADGVAVVRWRRRRGVFVTPSALLTDDDVSRLTTPVDPDEPTASDLEYTTVVTRSLQRDVVRGGLTAVLRHPVGVTLWVVLIIASLYAIVIGGQPGWVLLGFVALVVVAFPAMLVSGWRRIFRVGTPLGAEVTPEGLVLDVPYYPALITRAQIRRLERTPRCLVVVRRARGSVLVLPRDLLPAEALRDLTGQESTAL